MQELLLTIPIPKHTDKWGSEIPQMNALCSVTYENETINDICVCQSSVLNLVPTEELERIKSKIK